MSALPSTVAEVANSDRRQELRTPCAPLEVHVRELGFAGRSHTAMLLNQSASGIGVRITDPASLHVGDEVEVTLGDQITRAMVAMLYPLADGAARTGLRWK